MLKHSRQVTQKQTFVATTTQTSFWSDPSTNTPYPYAKHSLLPHSPLRLSHRWLTSLLPPSGRVISTARSRLSTSTAHITTGLPQPPGLSEAGKSKSTRFTLRSRPRHRTYTTIRSTLWKLGAHTPAVHLQGTLQPFPPLPGLNCLGSLLPLFVFIFRLSAFTCGSRSPRRECGCDDAVLHGYLPLSQSPAHPNVSLTDGGTSISRVLCAMRTCRSPLVVKGYHPSPVKFDATTTNAEHFPGHAIPPCSPLVARPYTPAHVRFEASTTTADHFPAHSIESPRRVVTKALTPSAAKFVATTTSADHFPAHPISPSKPYVVKPYNNVPLRFEAETTNQAFYKSHEVSPAPPPLHRPYTPTAVRFSATTTNRDTFVAHQLPEREMPGHRPASAARRAPASPLKFEAETTNQAFFKAHDVRSVSSPLRAPSYKPSAIRFDATTTMKDAFKGHDARARPPIGIAVADDGFLVMVHAAVEPPTRASKVFTTTEDGQSVVAVRILQGWSRLASENEPVGVFEMRGIPPASGGTPQIVVTLQLDERGRMMVEARDVNTGRHEEWRQAGGHVVLTDGEQQQQ